VSRELRTEIEIEAPPEQVWAVVMDPQRLEEWVTTHAGLGDGAPERLGEGDSFEQELKLSGAKFEVRWTVEECDRPRSVAWSGEGPGGSRASVRYTLEPQGEGTLFGYENSFELPGGALGRLAGRTVGDRVSRRESERSLENLKRLLE
jgi:carbon monoxide dehydrogenase subunit G